MRFRLLKTRLVSCLVVLVATVSGIALHFFLVKHSETVSDILSFYGGTGQFVLLEIPEFQAPKGVGDTVFIQGGDFMMGAPDGVENDLTVPGRGWPDAARPYHEERIGSFEIGKYKVTAKEYVAFLNDIEEGAGTVSRYVQLTSTYGMSLDGKTYRLSDGFEFAPAMGINFQGAEAYCRWLSEKTGERYRLPSEIEWEYTVRGSEGRRYPWGQESPIGRCYLRYDYSPQDVPSPPLVGQFPAYTTPEGVHDLIGGPQEWCSNYYYDYPHSALIDIMGEEKFQRFLRGEAIEGMSTLFDNSVAALRGGEYWDMKRQATANGWARHSGGLKTLTDNWRNYKSFRVLKELGPRSVDSD